MGYLAMAKLALIVICLLSLAGGVFGFVHHIKAKERDRIYAQLSASDAKEHQRREKALDELAKSIEERVAGIKQTESKHVEIYHTIETASRANDHRACLDADSVRRLNDIGHQAGHGASAGKR